MVSLRIGESFQNALFKKTRLVKYDDLFNLHKLVADGPMGCSLELDGPQCLESRQANGEWKLSWDAGRGQGSVASATEGTTRCSATAGCLDEFLCFR